MQVLASVVAVSANPMGTGLTYPEALLIGALQGVTELFPVSSLGHSVLIPALIGGKWATDLNVSSAESPYLAFVVGLHVATAIALLVYFWRDWVRIITGFGTSLRHRRIRTADERLAWMIILGTIPVGVAGLLLEHTFRTVLGRPMPAAIFLMINGVVLYAAERMRRRVPLAVPDSAGRVLEPEVAPQSPAGPAVADRASDMPIATATPQSAGNQSAVIPQPASQVGADRASDVIAAVTPRSALGQAGADRASDVRIARRSLGETTAVAAAQVAALLPGISRSGVTMAAGLARGLSHEDAARFSFLLATPVILAAGVLKVPDLLGPLGDGIRPQVLVGSLASGVCAYLSVRFLTRYFETRTLTPFAIYCFAAGAASLGWLILR
jgi:undecaprenyl-diphosphatase